MFHLTFLIMVNAKLSTKLNCGSDKHFSMTEIESFINFDPLLALMTIDQQHPD